MIYLWSVVIFILYLALGTFLHVLWKDRHIWKVKK